MYICKVINKVAEKRLVPKDSGQGTTGLSFEEYERIANEVVTTNKWGYGNTRRTRLEEAGYVYEAVQTIINHMFAPYPPIDMSYFNQNGSRSLSLAASNDPEPTETPVLRAAGDSYPTNLDIDIYQNLADEVIRGKWDNVPPHYNRQENLEAAGYYYPAVQTIVNHIMLPSHPDIDMKYFTPTSDDPSVDPDSPDSGDSDDPEPTPAPYDPDQYKEITVNVYKEHIFHYPPANDRNMVVLSGKISNEINRAGTFEFQLPPGNYCIKNKLFKKLTSIIEVYWENDSEPYFRGRILDTQKAFNGTMTFRCEGMMSVLNDSIVRPLGDSEKGINAPVGNLFNDLITFHNNQVYDAEDPDSPKYFKTIDIQGYDSTEFNFPYANYEKTLEYIQNNILSNEEVGGRMWVDGQTIHLHADTESLQTISEQPIVFGENLFDLTQNINASELYTVILPTGKDGLTLDGTDYIENSAAVAKFGRIWYHAEFSDVEDTSELRTKATEMLNRNIDEVTSIEVSALDMHIMNSDQKPLKIGMCIPVMSPPHGIDVSYICTAASIDICNPANTKYTLGVNPETLTTKQMKLSNNIAQTALQYKSESSVYNLTLTPAKDGGGNDKVTATTKSFYRTGSVIYLSFSATFHTNVAADTSMVIFEYDRENNPANPVIANGYNQTANKSCTIRSYNGAISIESATAIAQNNVVTCTMTWSRSRS